MKRQTIAAMCILFGCCTWESDWKIVPVMLLVSGIILTLEKKKTPSSRQAREGAKNKLLQPDYTMGR